jgi:uncharacterized delta-60 repeat protein
MSKSERFYLRPVPLSVFNSGSRRFLALMKSSIHAAILVALFFATFPVRADISGQLDPGFVPDSPGQPNGPVLCALNASNGAILVVGHFSQEGPLFLSGVGRLKANGSLDSSFNPGSGADDTINCAALQPNGKLLVGGLFQRFNTVPSQKIARLNVDGSIDTNFQSHFDTAGNVNAIAVLTNGSVLVGGAFTAQEHTNLVRLNSDGTLDSAFIASVSAQGVVNSILIQPDQRVLIAGTFTAVNGVTRNGICRLNQDGMVDLTFNPGPGTDGPIYTLCLVTNSTIVLGGRFSTLQGTAMNYLGALNADGSLARTFAPGTGPNDAVYSLAPDNGTILVGGRFTQFNGQPRGRIARILLDGELDASFGSTNGLGDSAFTVLPISGSNVLVGGSFTNIGDTPMKYLAEIAYDGVPDPDFNPARGIAGDIYSIIPLSSGQIVIGGGFLNIDGAGQSGLARLQSDGTVDADFRPPFRNSFVRSAAAQQTGRIVVGGVIYLEGTTNLVRLARVNADGSLDRAFAKAALDDRIQSVAVQPDDSILVIGSFLHCNGVTERGILRLNQDGVLDTSFNSGAGPDNNINVLAIQTYGRILIGGDFTKYNNVAKNHLARLNPNGSIDPTFNPTASANFPVAAVATLPDGKILIGGDFQMVNGVNRNRVARLGPDGSLDPTFDPGPGPNVHVGVILPQVDGRSIIGGFFTSVDGQEQNYFTRLNRDGTLDTNFQIGVGANFPVYALALQDDNKVLLGGSFQYLDTLVRSHIGRLLNQVDNPPIEARLAANGMILTVSANGNASVTLESSSDLSSWTDEGPVPVAPGRSIEVAVGTTNALQKFFRAVYR